MPYWNRPRELATSLSAYQAVYPGLDLEFSICDDGSRYPPAMSGDRVIVTTLPRKDHALNPCVPINVAVRAATREIVVLTNPEVEHREPVLQSMLAALESENDYVTTGCRETTNGMWLAGPLTAYGQGGREPSPPGGHFHFCAMFHRALFERVGGFDEQYRFGQGSDDNDWLFALQAAGANFRYVDGLVWHTRTPHQWTGTTAQNSAILHRKWGL